MFFFFSIVTLITLSKTLPPIYLRLEIFSKISVEVVFLFSFPEFLVETYRFLEEAYSYLLGLFGRGQKFAGIIVSEFPRIIEIVVVFVATLVLGHGVQANLVGRIRIPAVEAAVQMIAFVFKANDLSRRGAFYSSNNNKKEEKWNHLRFSVSTTTKKIRIK